MKELHKPTNKQQNAFTTKITITQLRAARFKNFTII